MGNPAGVKRNFKELERRRFEAMGLLKKGLGPTEAARRLGVARQTVVRWDRQRREGGRKALKMAGRAGRKPLLGAKDRRKLEKLLLKGPERLGYETPLWTCPRVAHLIEQKFGVRYHTGHVWKILVSLGWSPQRPAGRARERDENRIEHWKKKVWPEIKKKPSGKAVPSSSSTKAD